MTTEVVGTRWRPSGVFIGALVLIALQLAWKWTLLGRSYWGGDDLPWVTAAFDSGFTWDHIMRTSGAHFMPVGFAVAWGVTHAAVYDWSVAAGAMLLLQLLASLAVYRLLRVVFGVRPVVLMLLAVYLFTPMTIPGLTWWAASLEQVPFQIAVPLCLAAHVRYLQTGRFRHALLAALFLVFALGCFYVKAGVGLPLLMLGLTSAFYVPGGWGSAVLRALRGHWRAWALYALVIAATVPIYLFQRGAASAQEAPVSLPGLGASLSFARDFVGRAFPTTAVGGPWNWLGLLANPSTGMVVAAWILLALLIFLSVRYRRHAWRAWALLFIYVIVIDMLPILVGRAFAAGFFAFEIRYLTDAAPVLALCVGLAFLPVLGEASPYRRPVPDDPLVSQLWRVAVVAFVISAVWSSEAYAVGYTNQRAQARTYMSNVKSELAQAGPDADIYPRAIPPTVMVRLAITGEGLTSHVLAPLATPEQRARMRNPRPSHHPQVFDDKGVLRKMGVFGVFVNPPSGSTCIPAGSDGDVRFDVSPTGDPGQVGILVYNSSGTTDAVVRIGETSIPLRLEPGDNEIAFPLTVKATNVRFSPPPPGPNAGGGKVCVKAGGFGTPTPAGQAP